MSQNDSPHDALRGEPMHDRNHAYLADQVLRNWMVDNDSSEVLEYASDMGVPRETVTEAAMSLSLCPIHFIDWAICFDDRRPDCSQVRVIFPNSHDT